MNGLIEQWGNCTTPSSPVSFVIRYTQTPNITYSSYGSASSAAGFYGAIYNQSETSFQIDTNYSSQTKVNYYWLAIGY